VLGETLTAVQAQARVCTRCPQLVARRTHVVFGSGRPDADVLFVAEAPGHQEDAEDTILPGPAGALFDELLQTLGLTRADVFVAHAVKCCPPDNRAPTPAELANCEPYLWRQLELVKPVVVCPLGNFATKLLRGDTTDLRRIHGRPEVRTLGPRTVRLLPLYHPAAALYQRETVDLLRTDFGVIPELLAQGMPNQPEPEPPPEAVAEEVQAPDEPGPDQLELF
jgi:DNA polymerase